MGEKMTCDEMMDWFESHGGDWVPVDDEENPWGSMTYFDNNDHIVTIDGSSLRECITKAMARERK